MKILSTELTIEDTIRKAIHEHIKNFIENEITEQTEKIITRLRGEVGKISVELASMFSVQKFGPEITITFKDEHIKTAPKKE